MCHAAHVKETVGEDRAEDVGDTHGSPEETKAD
jgi:hypothetical protein